MNFDEAIEEMAKGNRVRLSDWMGYWFMIPLKEGEMPLTERPAGFIDIRDACRVRVFTRDGDILDTPKYGTYKDRDDWEVVTEPAWTFDMALRFLRNNKEVRRASWDTGVLAFMEYGGLYIDIDKAGTAEIYDPTREDILATDWQIVTD